jgi:hypothetical protein
MKTAFFLHLLSDSPEAAGNGFHTNDRDLLQGFGSRRVKIVSLADCPVSQPYTRLKVPFSDRSHTTSDCVTIVRAVRVADSMRRTWLARIGERPVTSRAFPDTPRTTLIPCAWSTWTASSPMLPASMWREDYLLLRQVEREPVAIAPVVRAGVLERSKVYSITSRAGSAFRARSARIR